jgi:ribonuclease P protein component
MVGKSAPQDSKKRFPKARRLLRRSDFERVYREGRRHFAAHLTVFYVGAARSQGHTGLRVGFGVGKALGGAVERNRLKRRLREAVRLEGFPAGVSADVVIHPKRSLGKAAFRELQQEVGRAFEVIEKSLATQAEHE